MRSATGPWCAELFGQDPDGPVADLMDLFAASWSRLGEVIEGFGSALDLITAAGPLGGPPGRAPGWEHKMYRDVSPHDGERVPLFKRAQITAVDLALAFGGEGPGRFDDLDRLTMFADNLVPHVLRLGEVLAYDDALLARIEADELLEHDSVEEVEIRAVAVHAVEQVVAALHEQGVAPATASRAASPAACPSRPERPNPEAPPDAVSRRTRLAKPTHPWGPGTSGWGRRSASILTPPWPSRLAAAPAQSAPG